jgi:hypothetical protein
MTLDALCEAMALTERQLNGDSDPEAMVVGKAKSFGERLGLAGQ